MYVESGRGMLKLAHLRVLLSSLASHILGFLRYMMDSSYKAALASRVRNSHHCLPMLRLQWKVPSSGSSFPCLILPTEIWLAILEYLPRQDMKSLVSICKPFRFVLFPLFRCTAVINLCRPWSYDEAPIPIDHRRMVTSLKVRMTSQLPMGEYDNAINSHFSNFADFSNLVEFNWVHRDQLPTEIYSFLRSHASLRVLTIESECAVWPESLLKNSKISPPKCALSVASIENYDIMKDIFRYGSASNRTITNLVIHHAFPLEALDAETVFPSLVHMDLRLSFGKLSLPFLFRFLDSNQTLEHITIRAWAVNPCTGMPAGRIPDLPRLKHFTVVAASHSPFLSLVFGRRTLDTLTLSGPLLIGEEIQRIPWEGLKDFDISLEDIVAQSAFIEMLGSSGETAWRRVTIRTSTLESWTDNLDVSSAPFSTNFNDLIDSYQVLHKFLTAMTNKAIHLTHLYIFSLFDYKRTANQPADDEVLRTLHGVAERLHAFPDWVKVKVSSRVGIRFIRFVRKVGEKSSGRTLSKTFGGPWWVGKFEGYDFQTRGWTYEM